MANVSDFGSRWAVVGVCGMVGSEVAKVDVYCIGPDDVSMDGGSGSIGRGVGVPDLELEWLCVAAIRNSQVKSRDRADNFVSNIVNQKIPAETCFLSS